MTTPKNIKLTYFDIEGAAEPVRLALILSGTDFTDERIAFADWKDLKPKTPYGAVPVLTMDGGPMKPQSMALLRLVGSEFSETLYPRDKLYDIEETIGLLEDVQKSWTPKLYLSMRPQVFGHPEGFGKTPEGQQLVKQLREQWVAEELPRFAQFLEARLEKNEWLVPGCDHPTIADCFAVPLLRSFTKGHIDHVPTTALDPYPKLVAYIQRFCALPSMAGRYTDGIH